jgi:hypothetical protein
MRAGRRGQELPPSLEAYHPDRIRAVLRRACRAAGVSRTTACALSPVGGRESGGRRPRPCARETRAAACGRSCSAGRCASRRASRQLLESRSAV